jgi:hypothetical protein
MEESLRVITELVKGIWLILVSAFELGIDLVGLLWSSSVSLPGPVLAGFTVASFLVGLLLGRISKRSIGTAEGTRDWRATGDERVVLDLASLRPLGLSAEEEVENEAMDISGLRDDETAQQQASGERAEPGRQESPPLR